MIFNLDREFVFVHVQKTGGMSIKKALSTIDGCVETNYHDFVSNLDNPEKFFKFSFVRNPFDRIVSWYNMGIKKNINSKLVGYDNTFWEYLLENSTNFSEFLNCTEKIMEYKDIGKPYFKSISFNQLDYFKDINGNIIMDYIGRFENIKDDFDKICNLLNINNLELPHINKFQHDDYRSYYTTKDIDKVTSLYSEDLKYFNYKFE